MCKRILASGGVNISAVCRVSREESLFQGLAFTLQYANVNLGECHSDFRHHSPKTYYDSALAGSNATYTLRLRDPTRSSVVGIRDPVPRRLFACAV